MRQQEHEPPRKAARAEARKVTKVVAFAAPPDGQDVLIVHETTGCVLACVRQYRGELCKSHGKSTEVENDAAVDGMGGGRPLLVVNEPEMSQALREASREQRYAMTDFCEVLLAQRELLTETIWKDLQNHAMLKCTGLDATLRHRATQMGMEYAEDHVLEAAYLAGKLKHKKRKTQNIMKCFPWIQVSNRSNFLK